MEKDTRDLEETCRPEMVQATHYKMPCGRSIKGFEKKVFVYVMHDACSFLPPPTSLYINNVGKIIKIKFKGHGH